MKKLIIIYGRNTGNKGNTEIEPYYDFRFLKNTLIQYDYLIFLDDTVKYDEDEINIYIEYLIENKLDQLYFNNLLLHQNNTSSEYDIYKSMIKCNKIFNNLTKEDVNHKNNTGFVPSYNILEPSIIRIKNFIIDTFYLKKNKHIENMYWKLLEKNNFKIGYFPQPPPQPPPQPQPIIFDNQSGDNLTIVSGFLDIKIKRPAKNNTPAQLYDYIEKSRGTLQIPQYMVLYCSEELIDDVLKVREEYGLLDKTKIIKITLENNLYMIHKLQKIRENVEKNTPPYNIPEYILAVNSRYGYIQNAIENNYFKTDYFAWVDFSASHIVNIPPNQKITYSSHDKIRIGWIARYSNNKFVYNHYCLGGGIFVGYKEIMIELIKIHHKQFVELMDMGYNINDDKLLFIIMEQNPYLFDTYYSAYKNLFIRL